MFDPRKYWEARARLYASSTGGWKAVCLHGTPEIYNRLVHRLQGSALRRALGGAARGRCLDFGCGVGRWMLEISSRARLVVGVDISSEMLGEARRRLAAGGVTNARVCLFDGSRLPFMSSVFDVTFTATVLIHVTEDEALRRAVGEICRVTRPDGRVVVLEGFSPVPVETPSHVVFRREEDLAELFGASGWLLRSSRPVYFHLPGEESLASRRSRALFRLLSPFYYLLNVGGRILSLRGTPPVQRVQVYSHAARG